MGGRQELHYHVAAAAPRQIARRSKSLESRFRKCDLRSRQQNTEMSGFNLGLALGRDGELQ
jgi:hypothetical protein